jgi:LysR family transcriptional regulator, cys regulon transcriptional activator
MVPASQLFPDSTSHIAFRRGALLRRYMYDFMQWFAPHLTRELVDELVATENKQERDESFRSHVPELPVR